MRQTAGVLARIILEACMWSTCCKGELYKTVQTTPCSRALSILTSFLLYCS